MEKIAATLPKESEVFFFSGLSIFLAPGGPFPWAARTVYLRGSPDPVGPPSTSSAPAGQQKLFLMPVTLNYSYSIQPPASSCQCPPAVPCWEPQPGWPWLSPQVVVSTTVTWTDMCWLCQTTCLCTTTPSMAAGHARLDPSEGQDPQSPFLLLPPGPASPSPHCRGPLT